MNNDPYRPTYPQTPQPAYSATTSQDIPPRTTDQPTHNEPSTTESFFKLSPQSAAASLIACIVVVALVAWLTVWIINAFIPGPPLAGEDPSPWYRPLLPVDTTVMGGVLATIAAAALAAAIALVADRGFYYLIGSLSVAVGVALQFGTADTWRTAIAPVLCWLIVGGAAVISGSFLTTTFFRTPKERQIFAATYVPAGPGGYQS